MDNCPKVPNADQGNEDGDKFGDVCDPCPIDNNNNPSDPDGDGVAAPCDPNPNTPGDKIELFEGFHHGLPATWSSLGTWTTSGDDIRTAESSANGGYLAAPTPFNAKATLSAGVVVEQLLNTGTDDGGVGVCNPIHGANATGVCCELYQSSPTT